MGNIINPVIQEWVMELGWLEQTGLISAIRGLDSCDIDKELDCSCKKITRMIRFLVLNNADIRTGFMTDRVMEINKVVDILNTINDQVSQGHISIHWFEHIMMAIKIIMKKHPNAYTRMYWLTVYLEYKTTPTESIQVHLKETVTTELNMDDIKGILTEIEDSGVLEEPSDIYYDGIKSEKVEETSVSEETGLKAKPKQLSLDMDRCDVTDFTPIRTPKKKPVVAIAQPELKDEETVVEDAKELAKNPIGKTIKHTYTIQRMLTSDNKAVYDFSTIPENIVSQFISLFVNLDRLDAVLTGNWNMKDDLMSDSYDIHIPIYRGPLCSISIHDSNKNTFLIDNVTGELIYVDDSLTHWIINSRIYGDSIVLTLTTGYKNGRGYLIMFNDSITPKGDSVDTECISDESPRKKDDMSICGEIRVRD